MNSKSKRWWISNDKAYFEYETREAAQVHCDRLNTWAEGRYMMNAKVITGTAPEGHLRETVCVDVHGLVDYARNNVVD